MKGGGCYNCSDSFPPPIDTGRGETDADTEKAFRCLLRSLGGTGASAGLKFISFGCAGVPTPAVLVLGTRGGEPGLDPT